jgi:UDP-N-acetylglucosamine diphosphorylase/glucosamine-1-phosphate N-acetyltransferase
MALRICVYEDDKFSNFYPLTLLRPVYTLRPGVAPIFRRTEFHFPDCNISLVARDQIGQLLSEQLPDYPVSIVKREGGCDVLFLNGRIRSFGDLPRLVKETRLSTAFRSNGAIVGVLFKVDTFQAVPVLATHAEYMREYQFHREDIPDFDTSATLYNYLWEMVADIETAVADDIASLKRASGLNGKANIRDGAFLIAPEQIHLGDAVEIHPGAMIDASKGPVLIGPNTRVESHAAVYGPCYVGANSVVLAGKISQCSIGPTCRVGGELEESILQSYVNKYHAGFIGHSYVGSWVNFGAMTTNSDLKNNYSPIRVSVGGKMIDTGSIKVGSFIGDHTKFGIGTLLNTGINIGVCCNLFGGGLTIDKEIPSFSWGNSGKFHANAFDKAIDTAQHSAERRNVAVSTSELELLKLVSQHGLTSAGVLTF